MILKVQNKPSSNICFENLFNDYHIEWTAIYMFTRLVTYNTYMRSFQYKILNVLFSNKILYTFGITPSPLCSFCNLYDETPLHIFYECNGVKCLWVDLIQCFQNNLKPGSHLPKKILFICFNESHFKKMKNVFYFILKALFVLKIFKFLS